MKASRTAGTILGIVPVAVFFCLLIAQTAAFVPNSISGRKCHQRSELSFIHGMNSRRKSILHVGNTQEDMEDSVLLLPLYEAELAKLKASEEDDTERIKELTNTIDDARTAAEFGVRRVQAEFYDSFSTADYKKMANVWSQSDDACCTHPGMHSLIGIDAVMDSWRQIFAGYAGSDDKKAFMIRPSRVKVDICGRTAICTCVEETNGGRLEALNIYRREEGTWKMVNHMASPVIM